MSNWTDDRITRLEDYAREHWTNKGDKYCDSVFKSLEGQKSDEHITAIQKKREQLDSLLLVEKTAITVAPDGSDRNTQAHWPVIEKIEGWLNDDLAGKHTMSQWTDDRIKRLEDYAQKNWVNKGDDFCDHVFQGLQAKTAMQDKRRTLEDLLDEDSPTRTVTAFASVSASKNEKEKLVYEPVIKKIETWLNDDLAGKH